MVLKMTRRGHQPRRGKGSSGLVSYTASLWKPSIRLAWTVRIYFSCKSINKKHNFYVKQVTVILFLLMQGLFQKNILEVMNVDGLSRDNVASHLQVQFLLLCMNAMFAFFLLLYCSIYIQSNLFLLDISNTILMFMSTEFVCATLLLCATHKSSSGLHTNIEFGINTYTCNITTTKHFQLFVNVLINISINEINLSIF